MAKKKEETSGVEDAIPGIDYITAPGISYSSLSRLVDGPQAYLNREKLEGDHLDNGSAVDAILTEGDDSFHKKFYVMTAIKPSSEMMLAYAEEMLISDDHGIAFTVSGYKTAVTPAKWEKEGKPYYDAVKKAQGRIVLSYEQYMLIQSTVNQLKENKYTRGYFDAAPSNVEIIYQFEYYFDIPHKTPTPAKIKVDILIIDHEKKLIWGKDLKTTSKPPAAFLSSYKNYKYYLQGGLYQMGIKHYARVHHPEYAVVDFEFIVAQMGAFNLPLIFTMSSKEYMASVLGQNTQYGTRIKGIFDLLDDLEYYNSTNMWEYKKEIVENRGRINLNLFTEE